MQQLTDTGGKSLFSFVQNPVISTYAELNRLKPSYSQHFLAHENALNNTTSVRKWQRHN